MAWHILHGLLEQIRVYSTFPGKVWIILMFIFRIVVVARIGDHVYHDEQSSFICNTLTPGCKNVCYNLFRPISELRFWSLMVIVVSTPGILFCLYCSHKIYHATTKYPPDKESKSDSEQELRPKKRRKRGDTAFSNASAPQQLYEVKKMNSQMDVQFKEKNSKEGSEKPPKYSKVYSDDEKYLLENRKPSYDSDFSTFNNDARFRKWSNMQPNNGYPIYADSRGRKIAFIKDKKPIDEEHLKRASKELLKNPQLYRAYWWHVFIRSAFEIAFLVGQYFLYGFSVSELFECERDPCVKIVDCYVSRPMEKTVMMYIMFVLGSLSCLLSIAEFYSLGLERFRYAFCCTGPKVSYEEKRKRLASLAHHEHDHGSLHPHHHKKKHDVTTVPAVNKFTRPVSLSSLSSESTVESV